MRSGPLSLWFPLLAFLILFAVYVHYEAMSKSAPATELEIGHPLVLKSEGLFCKSTSPEHFFMGEVRKQRPGNLFLVPQKWLWPLVCKPSSSGEWRRPHTVSSLPGAWLLLGPGKRRIW